MFRQFQISGVGGGGHYKTHHVMEHLSALIIRLCKQTEPSRRAPSHQECGVLALQQEENPAQCLPMPGMTGWLSWSSMEPLTALQALSRCFENISWSRISPGYQQRSYRAGKYLLKQRSGMRKDYQKKHESACITSEKNTKIGGGEKPNAPKQT